MKKALILAGVVSAMALAYQPAWAKCVPLIKEAREQLASAKLSKVDETRVKALLM